MLALGMVGMIEASTTDNLSTPWTWLVSSTTALGSWSRPMRQVPTG